MPKNAQAQLTTVLKLQNDLLIKKKKKLIISRPHRGLINQFNCDVS